jgi:4-hydroxythreonine-4-phosphate dehydrogenase
VFHQAMTGRYDAVICMYHDQALGPLKTVHFHDGYNLTCGLSVPRISPDHGTAYDIAGKGVADPGSMIQAIVRGERMAALVSASRGVADDPNSPA